MYIYYILFILVDFKFICLFYVSCKCIVKLKCNIIFCLMINITIYDVYLIVSLFICFV